MIHPDLAVPAKARISRRGFVFGIVLVMLLSVPTGAMGLEAKAAIFGALAVIDGLFFARGPGSRLYVVGSAAFGIVILLAAVAKFFFWSASIDELLSLHEFFPKVSKILPKAHDRVLEFELQRWDRDALTYEITIFFSVSLALIASFASVLFFRSFFDQALTVVAARGPKMGFGYLIPGHLFGGLFLVGGLLFGDGLERYLLGERTIPVFYQFFSAFCGPLAVASGIALVNISNSPIHMENLRRSWAQCFDNLDAPRATPSA